MAAPDQRKAALDLLRQWIVNALQSKRQGNATAYWKLLDQMELIRADPDKVRVFSLCVSYFDTSAHEALLTQLLGLSLWACPPAVAEATVDFAVNLACVRPSCLPLALDFLVRSFMPPSCGIPAFMGLALQPPPSQPLTPGKQQKLQQQEQLVAALARSKENKAMDLQHKEQVLLLLHQSLSRILSLVPQSPSTLAPILHQRQPHRRLDLHFQCIFFDALFGLAEGKGTVNSAGCEQCHSASEQCRGRSHQQQLMQALGLAAAVDHLIQIDVEIRWEDILEMQQQQQWTQAEKGKEEELDGDSNGDAIGNHDAESGRGSKRKKASGNSKKPFQDQKSVFMFHMDLDDGSDEECVRGGESASHLEESRGEEPGSELVARHGLITCRRRVQEGSSKGQQASAEAVDEMADKMDALMDLTLDHIRRTVGSCPAASMRVYKALERCFDATILETHRSKFTQFLLFYACALPLATHGAPQGHQEPTVGTPVAAAAFIEHLISLAQLESQPQGSRLSAVAYLASFIARASYVALDTVLDVLGRLMAWCITGMPAQDLARGTTRLGKGARLGKSASAKNPAHPGHAVPLSPVSQALKPSFSALNLRPRCLTLQQPSSGTPVTPRSTSTPSMLDGAFLEASSAVTPAAALSSSVSSGSTKVLRGAAQAVLYILCFRMEEMAEDTKAMAALKALPVTDFLSSPLRPLTTCLGSITSEFQRQALHLGLIDEKVLAWATCPAPIGPDGLAPGVSAHGPSLPSPVPRPHL